jgi:hypothetical protein
MPILRTLSPHPQAQQHAPTCLSHRHPHRHPHSHLASLRRPHGQYSRLSRIILPRQCGGSVSVVGHPRQALTAVMHHRPSSSRSAKTASRLIWTTCRSRSAEQMHGEPRSLRRASITSEKFLLTFVVRGRGNAARASRCRFYMVRRLAQCLSHTPDGSVLEELSLKTHDRAALLPEQDRIGVDTQIRDLPITVSMSPTHPCTCPFRVCSVLLALSIFARLSKRGTRCFVSI